MNFAENIDIFAGTVAKEMANPEFASDIPQISASHECDSSKLSLAITKPLLTDLLTTNQIRQEGMRLFLIWYQILGEELSHVSDIEQIYASLVPGVVPNIANPFLATHPLNPNHEFSNMSAHDSNGNPITSSINSSEVPNILTLSLSSSSVQSCPVEPFVPVFHVEPQPRDSTCYYLQCLLDYMITQSSKIHWKEQKEMKQLRCFEFLWQQFRKIYLANIFPNLTEVSLYKPSPELPVLRKCIDDNQYFDSNRFPHRDTLLHAQSVVVRWLSKYLKSDTTETTDRNESIEEQQHYNRLYHSHQNIVTLIDNHTEWREPTAIEYQIIETVFNSTRYNVNLIHSLFKEAFLLPFSHAMTIRQVITVYRHWIYGSAAHTPFFLGEPSISNNVEEEVRAGMSCLLRVFVSIAANVFLLEVPSDKPLMLEEQVDLCKRVLNIYRYMVMKIEMDKLAWLVKGMLSS